MSNAKVPDVTTDISPNVAINYDVAIENRQKASAHVARADTINLRDDPEAKAAFLATFTAEEEKRIMRKVSKVFFVLTGIMYLIKQVSRCLFCLFEETHSHTARLM